MTELALPYEPRPQFIPFHQRENRFALMVCHRRAGKTVSCVNEIILRALLTKKKRAKYAYVGPFRQQAKEVAWEYLKEGTENIRNGPPRESDLRVKLHNDATITIYGADNPDSLRGLYFDGIILDEFGDMRPTLWGEVILPTLLDRRGWACFIGTPKGKNHFYKMYQRSIAEDNWYSMTLKASESGLISEEDLAEAKAEMTDDQYLQEMECSFEAAVPGTYYANILAKMDGTAHFGQFPHDPLKPVFCSADLGFSDSTAFWFWQMDEEGPILIDYHEADSQPLSYYFEMLASKGYEYEIIWLPHDAKAATLQTGRSTIEQFLDKGFPCKIAPKLSLQHGIDAARKMLPRCRFDENATYKGVEALRAYRRKFNEKTQQYADTPLHDWASNGADAFRYFGLVTDSEMETEIAVIEDEPLIKPPEYCLDDLFAARESDNWRESVLRIG